MILPIYQAIKKVIDDTLTANAISGAFVGYDYGRINPNAKINVLIGFAPFQIYKYGTRLMCNDFAFQLRILQHTVAETDVRMDDLLPLILAEKIANAINTKGLLMRSDVPGTTIQPNTPEDAEITGTIDLREWIPESALATYAGLSLGFVCVAYGDVYSNNYTEWSNATADVETNVTNFN